MNLIDSILSRRSIRKYTSQKILDEDLNTILKCGMYAPSAVNKQPWHFIVFNSDEKKEELIEIHPNASMLKGAALSILVCYDTDLQHDEGYGPVDCSAATQNMLLAAHTLGIGSCWIGIYPRQERINLLKNIFELPSNIVPFSVIAFGYPTTEPASPDRFKPNRIHYEEW